ncbi:hypothetical protein KBY28_07900 [Ruegeria pomeroyi]|uniref:hypothetical protein n=1 Tax=Ruegeria pomeroyi TaxID=89184 RepID=UPI001F44C317|nr:hypothetical protein [Ruegeria pomeroyi]MCE8508373.1 hypothetical protein [Ruegeria pomeroyi]
MPNDTVDGGIPAPAAQAAPPAPTAAAEKPKPAGWRATLSNLSSLIKDFGIVAAIVATPIAIVVVVIWEGVLRPRLTAEIMTELSRPDEGYRAWHRDNVIGALSGFHEDTWKKWRDADDKQVIERLARPPEAEEIKALFEDEEFQEFFRNQVLLSVSGYKQTNVNEIYERYGKENLLKAWLSPVTDQVDAVYPMNLYYRKTVVRDNAGREVFDADGHRVFNRDSRTEDEFYATKDQLFDINVEPLTTGGFFEPFNREETIMTLTIGGVTKDININGYSDDRDGTDDITCDIRRALNNRDYGFVKVRAGVKRTGPTDPLNPMDMDSHIPDGGFEMKIIVTAKKGKTEC